MRAIPVSFAWFVRWVGGVDSAMERWGGPEVCKKEEGTVGNGIHLKKV